MKNVLFVCSQNRLRSPTAEQVFSSRRDIEVASAGTNHDADSPLTHDLVSWADIIFVMEKAHRAKLQQKFKASLKKARVICLDIPVDDEFMDPGLVSSAGSARLEVSRLNDVAERFPRALERSVSANREGRGSQASCLGRRLAWSFSASASPSGAGLASPLSRRARYRSLVGCGGAPLRELLVSRRVMKMSKRLGIVWSVLRRGAGAGRGLDFELGCL
ncbi:Protein tyrosine phosphatase-like protein (modular protein) [Mesorhizobium prunaredense]|uniref:Protein tyrosine phosphatase-like protein (Modular protein) n=1 Tax=Mesorhizobium prunaredense TaxID=1631249 RepID=A0A1R3V3V0_9HYPH|nr:Protein tyrosine phosphatase-like protein (modular protein) [Mesorhizobium prunaredense]